MSLPVSIIKIVTVIHFLLGGIGHGLRMSDPQTGHGSFGTVSRRSEHQVYLLSSCLSGFHSSGGKFNLLASRTTPQLPLSHEIRFIAFQWLFAVLSQPDPPPPISKAFHR
jgi:hypothetical protein